MATTSLFFDIFARDINAKETFARIESAGLGVGKSLGSMLAPLGLGLAGLGIADAVGHMIKAAGDFEAQNTRLATSAGEAVGNLKMVADGILQVARDTGTATGELEKGAYYIESAGYHGVEMLTVLKAAAQGAKAEGSSVETVGDAVTSVLRDYHLNASDAANVTSKLVAAVGDGKSTFELFTGALHSVLPVAAQAHISLDDILGDLASMTVHGMSADQAAQDLNHTIMKLINPTQQSTSEFALLGTTAQEVQAKLGTSGLSGTLNFLHDKIVNAMPPGSDKVILDMKTAMSSMTPEVRGLATQMAAGSISTKDMIKQAREMSPLAYDQAKAFLALIGQTHKLGTEQITGEQALQNYAQSWRLVTGDQTGANTAMMLTAENAEYTHKAVDDVSKSAADASGNVKGWSEVQDTFNNKLDRFKESVVTAGIKIGEKLLPALGDAATGFADFINKVAPMLPDLWDNHIQPVLESIGKLLVAVFGSGSGGGGDAGNAADGFGNSMTKVGDDAGHTLGTGGTVAKAVDGFGKSLDSFAEAIQHVTDTVNQINFWVTFVERELDQSRADIIVWAAAIVQGWDNGLETMAVRAASFQMQIMAAFANASAWLIDAGANIVLGLINGMVGMIPTLMGQAASMANAAVDSVRVALGIHSPSLVFRGIGVNLAEGLALGIGDGHGTVKNAMGRLSAVTTASFDMTGGVAGGAFRAAPAQVNVYVGNEKLESHMYRVASNAIGEADRYAVRRQAR